MKGPKELKRYMSILRKIRGKPNGVIGPWALDDLRIFKLEACKKWKLKNRGLNRIKKMTIALKMIKAGVVYSHDGNGRILKAWKASWVERLVLTRLAQKILHSPAS